jgi:hypothetical protein
MDAYASKLDVLDGYRGFLANVVLLNHFLNHTTDLQNNVGDYNIFKKVSIISQTVFLDPWNQLKVHTAYLKIFSSFQGVL